MDFFERQDEARTNSRKLILLFALALPCVAAAVYAVCIAVSFVIYAFIAFWGSVFVEIHGSSSPDYFISLWQPALLLWVAAITFVVVIGGSLFKIRQLAPGGRVVAELLGGERLNPATKKLDELRLLHVVEEMSVASGTPMPEIYVLRREFGLNAFVAGHTVSDMIVCATEGCVRDLTRDELQGVIAHEYSHILNGDMRLNMRLMGLVHGLLCITLASYWVMSGTYSERERDIGGEPEVRTGIGLFLDVFILIVGFLLAFIGWNGSLFGRMIKGAVSRQREFLADAAAVEFTRYPEGLINALKKVKTSPEGSVIRSPHAEEASHIFFCNGLADERIRLTSTHPPIDERIKRIEVMMGRDFVPEAKPVREREEKQARIEPREGIAEYVTRALAPKANEAATPSPVPGAVAAEAALSNVGVPAREHLVFAVRLIEQLPEPIKAATREAKDAVALIYALLVGADERVRAAQIQLLKRRIMPEAFEKTNALLAEAGALNEHARIPLIALTLPALRRLQLTDYAAFMENVESLVAADRQVDLFEFALQKMLRRHLEPNFKAVPKPEVRYYSLNGLTNACSVVLSALAHAGEDTVEQARTVFARGVARLRSANREFKFMALEDCTLSSLEVALNNLAEAAGQPKKLFLEACAQTVAADGQIRPREAELLRAIADALDCPMPPFAS